MKNNTIKKLFAMIAAGALFTTVFAGCQQDSGSGTSSAQSPSVSAASQPDTTEQGTTNITFWHAMNTDVLAELVKEFNNSQTEIYADCIYQGGYGDTMNAFKLAMNAGGQDAPDIVQIYEGGTAFMIESGFATPVQKYIDEENYDLSQLVDTVRGYYTINGTLYSMPFNSSNAILYYNKDMFRAAGLDPEEPPETFAELGEYAKKLNKDGVAGMALPIDCSLFEFNMVNIGQDIVDQGNGRTGRATKAIFAENGGGLRVFQAYKNLYDTGACTDFGSDSLKAFLAQKTAMTLSSSSLITTAEKGIAGSFELGIAGIPLLEDGVNNGIPVGGGTLWLANKGDETRERASFQLLKYLVEPEPQAKWHMATGYYAICEGAYELDIMKEFYQENPLFEIAVDQMRNSPATAVSAVYGVNMEARSKIQDHWRAMMEGAETPQQAISSAEQEITALIEQYNLSNPQ